MKMLNLDTLKQQKIAIMQKLSDATKTGAPEDFTQALDEMADWIQKAVMAEYQGAIQAADSQILSGRGVRQLTSEENQYFQKVITAMASSNPIQALADIANVMPKTVVDAVFEDLVAEHPLLDAIGFQNTSGLVEFLVNTNGIELATWGTLTSTIVTELTGGFKKINLTLNKLSAFLPIAKSMLDLGPAYMDRYVRATLGEALYYGLEKGVIDGTGKDMPIGMNRNVSAEAVVVDRVQPLKATVAITKLTPITYAPLLATLAVGPNGKSRIINRVMLICNPVDYVGKIFPATTILRPDGTYVNNVFPFPTDVYQSTEVPSGKAVLGLPKRYFMGIGTAKSGKIEYDDSYKFLEDERVYLVKLYGHGEPLDNNAFIYLDISGLLPGNNEVYVLNPEDFPVANVPAYPDARLASLKVGALSLAPIFNKSVMNYEVATTDATNTITAVAKDGEGTVAIKLNGAVHTNGTAATWSAGANTVEVTVSIAGETEVYNLIVTKS